MAPRTSRMVWRRVAVGGRLPRLFAGSLSRLGKRAMLRSCLGRGLRGRMAFRAGGDGFRRCAVEADELVQARRGRPDADYRLAEQNGPWMIMAASFADKGGRGAGAGAWCWSYAREYKLAAYIHQKTFDYSDSVNGLGVDKYGRAKKMKHRRDVKSEEIAVLVGNYPSVDDAQAQKDMEKLKHIYPDALRPNKSGRSNQQLAWWHNLQRQAARMSGKQQAKGPMGRSFVTTNPLLPPQFFASRGVDKLVEDMNRGVKHSLLDCPAKYTVLVATFKGNVIIDQSKIEKIEQGDARSQERSGGRGRKGPRSLRGAAGEGLRGLRVSRPHGEHRDRRALQLDRHAAGRRQDGNQPVDLQDHADLRRRPTCSCRAT